MWNLRDKYNGGPLEQGDRLYFGFAFLVSENSDTLDDEDFLLYQLWQGSPFRPPLSLHLVGDDNGRLYVELVHYESVREGRSEARRYRVGEVVRGEWAEFVIGARVDMNPDDGRDGWLSSWRLGCGTWWRVQHETGLQVGYDPTDPDQYADRDGRRFRPKDILQATFGAYRRRQPNYVKLFFDDVRVDGLFHGVSGVVR